MPLTADDLKFFASATMTDAASAGGARDGTALQDGENNVFPDTTEDERMAGYARLRKVYPSVASASGDALLAGSVALDTVPSDPAISCALVRYGDAATTRQQCLDNAFPVTSSGYIGGFWSPQYTFDGGTSVLHGDTDVGDRTGTLVVVSWGVSQVHVSVIVATAGLDHTLAEPFPAGPAGQATSTRAFANPGNLRVYGVVGVRGALTAGAAAVPLVRPTVKVAPLQGAALPIGDAGVPSLNVQATAGHALALAAGDFCALWHEDETAPAVAVDAGTVNVGRTNLDQLAVVGADGVEIARFLASGPAVVGAGCSADLAAGTVTFSDVSGYAQPVSVRHRIAERVHIAGYAHHEIQLSAGVSRDYPAGSNLSPEVPLGDMVPAETLRFSQQAWTRVWSDAVIGNPAAALYQGAVGLTAGGTELDRWAVVFTSATQFDLMSERWGQVASGNTGTDFSPLNPETGHPLFTLYATGWRSPAAGNVLRLNTTGAYAPVWVLRCVSPGATAAADGIRLRMRGSINA